MRQPRSSGCDNAASGGKCALQQQLRIPVEGVDQRIGQCAGDDESRQLLPRPGQRIVFRLLLLVVDPLQLVLVRKLLMLQLQVVILLSALQCTRTSMSAVERGAVNSGKLDISLQSPFKQMSHQTKNVQKRAAYIEHSLIYSTPHCARS